MLEEKDHLVGNWTCSIQFNSLSRIDASSNLQVLKMPLSSGRTTNMSVNMSVYVDVNDYFQAEKLIWRRTRQPSIHLPIAL